MKRRVMGALVLVAGGVVGACGCASRAGCSAGDAEIAEQVRMIAPCAAVGNARHLAHWMERDMNLTTGGAQAERGGGGVGDEWRAAARELRASANALDAAIVRYDTTGRGREALLKDIERSTADLEREYEATIQRWKRSRGRGG